MGSTFTLTEWEWLKVQLRVRSLEARSEKLKVYYTFEADDIDSEALIACDIFSEHAQTMIDKEMSRKEQLSYYNEWVALEKEHIRDVLEGLPKLKQVLDPEKHVEFNIMYSYGMGWMPVCEIVGTRVSWNNVE